MLGIPKLNSNDFSSDFYQDKTLENAFSIAHCQTLTLFFAKYDRPGEVLTLSEVGARLNL